MLVVAPRGVHRNWIAIELERHLPDDVAEHTLAHAYDTGRANTKRHKAAVEAVLYHRGLAILTIGYESFMTQKGKEASAKFLKRRRVLYVLDEAARIKTPSAKRSRSVVRSGPLAKYRRVLTGTPVANSPFDVYTPIKFLCDDFWKERDLHPFSVFKTHFGVWQTMHSADGQFPKCIAYRNLDQLNAIMREVGSRVTKEEALDLPPKLYSRRHCDLSKPQQDAYQQLKDECVARLAGGEEVTAILALTMMLRFATIASGYVRDDDGRIHTFKDNPKLELLKDEIEDLRHPAIIWAWDTHSIDIIMELLRGRAVRYDGQTKGDRAREEAVARFQAGDFQFFVAKPSTAGEGLTLTAARTVIYFNNTFKLTERLQSEDRAHRIGQEHPVHYVDLVAAPIEERVLRALRTKRNVASIVNGDNLMEWI
jgi:SNF2 family DNA or RNA helicase